MRISDWSSDVCSSDLLAGPDGRIPYPVGDVEQPVRPAVAHGDRRRGAERVAKVDRHDAVQPAEVGELGAQVGLGHTVGENSHGVSLRSRRAQYAPEPPGAGARSAGGRGVSGAELLDKTPIRGVTGGEQGRFKRHT